MSKRIFQEFPTETPSSYPTREHKELFSAILNLKNTEEAQNFFRDLFTMAELNEFANRWQMVKMLIKGRSYLYIAEALKTSTTTVTRVAHWLFNGMSGYKTIADRMYPKKFKDSLSKKPFKLRGKRTFF